MRFLMRIFNYLGREVAALRDSLRGVNEFTIARLRPEKVLPLKISSKTGDSQ